MRATEFLDFLNRERIKVDEINYSHFEYRDLDTGKIIEKYRKIRRKHRNQNVKENKSKKTL